VVMTQEDPMVKLVSGMIPEEKKPEPEKKKMGRPAGKAGAKLRTEYAPRARSNEETQEEEEIRQAQLAKWYTNYPCEACQKTSRCSTPCEAWLFWFKKAWKEETARLRGDLPLDKTRVMREIRKVFCRKEATKEDRQAALRICRNLFGPTEAEKLANIRGITMED